MKPAKRVQSRLSGCISGSMGDRLLTTKADNKAHGYGVKSMMQMAEQLHGMLTWRQEKQVFTLSVLMQDIGA